MTLIGGAGRMGRLLAESLTAAGHETRVLDAGDWDRAPELLGDADLALLCAPIEAMLEVIPAAAKHLPAEAALADITSVKTPYVRAMLEAHPGPVLGLHPMFGPSVGTLLAQRVVVCPARRPEAYRWFLELLESHGARLVETTPEEHDRMMTAIQAIRHFATLCFGSFLASEGVDAERSLAFSSPVYRLEVDMVGRLFAQDAALYADIMLATPERREAIGRLAELYGRMARLAAANDREGLIAAFEEAAAAWGPEAQRALEESDRVIEFLGHLLTAREDAHDSP